MQRWGLHLRPLSALAALAALSGGCATADLRAAHSLDRGEWAGGVAVGGGFVAMTGELTAATPLDPDPAGAGLSAPARLADLDLEGRVGLGEGWALGLRGLPVRPRLGVSWSPLDERRQAVPLSLAATVEAGVAPTTGVAWGAGLAASRTAVLSSRVALVPMGGAWVGPSAEEVRLPLPDRYAADPDGPTPTLWVAYQGLGMSLPAGLEAPVRVGQGDLAVVPWLAWNTHLVWGDEVDRGCDNCMAGTQDLARIYSARLWLGVRVRPWLDPARRTR